MFSQRIPEGLHAVAFRHWKALSLNLHLEDQYFSLRYTLALYVLHLFGVSIIARLTHQPFWFFSLVLLLIQPVLIFLKIKRWYFLPESLAPFGLAYVVAFLRVLIALFARAQGLTWERLTVPEPWDSLLNLNMATALSLTWILTIQAGLYVEALRTTGNRPYGWSIVLGHSILILSLVWSTATFLVHRPHGVTASDPYAYVQMAVDLIQRGSLLHRFDLATKVADWGLSLWPLVPVGYLPPNPETGEAATVWPPGYSVFLAGAYWLGGETGLYILTPLLGLVSLLVLWFFALEALHFWQKDWQFLAAGIATYILATSYQQVEHALIPMADIGSQLFTTLTLLLIIRGMRTNVLLNSILSGLCLGIAFAIRYTQVLIACSVLTAAFLYQHKFRPRSWRSIVLPVVGFAISAWIPALGVLWYHQVAFGSPFKVGSQELMLFGWEHLPITFARILYDLFRTNEFFYLIPFFLWGLFRLWQRSWQTLVIIWSGQAVVILFHLFYAALRLRDLLSVLPALALVTGFGMVDLWVRAFKIENRFLRKSCLIALLICLGAALWLRTRITWQLPFSKSFNTFGYLSVIQRQAFGDLARLTPPTGIIAASLNSGPIYLYAGRSAVRPAYWSEEDWLSFLARALSNNYRVFLLLDGDEMEKPKVVALSHYRLVSIASLPLPYFHPDGSSENVTVALYEITLP